MQAVEHSWRAVAEYVATDGRQGSATYLGHRQFQLDA